MSNFVKIEICGKTVAVNKNLVAKIEPVGEDAVTLHILGADKPIKDFKCSFDEAIRLFTV